MTRERRPVVSIAIPAYQPGPVFGATLKSCLEQTFENIEVVVALDGKDAQVEQAIASAGDPRVRLVSDGSRQGQFGNFNRVVDECRGDYVKLLSADDLLSRDCVALMKEAMECHPKIGLCSAPHVTFWSRPDGTVEPRLQVPFAVETQEWAMGPEEGRRFTARYGNQVGGPSNVMVRRSAWWQTGGFDPRMNHSGEQNLWFRLIGQSGFLLLSRPLIAYRMHANSVTGRGATGADRVDQPFMIAESSTLGAVFPNSLWRERAVRILQTVNSTSGYAAARVRRGGFRGIGSLWRVWMAGGAALAPLTVPLSAWAILRSSVLGMNTQWPFPEGLRSGEVSRAGLCEDSIVALISNEEELRAVQAQVGRQSGFEG